MAKLWVTCAVVMAQTGGERAMWRQGICRGRTASHSASRDWAHKGSQDRVMDRAVNGTSRNITMPEESPF